MAYLPTSEKTIKHEPSGVQAETPGCFPHLECLIFFPPQLLLRIHTRQGISGFGADVDEDYAWLKENVFDKSPEVFPAGKFGPGDFRWAVGVALSRSFFVSGELRLTPLVDFANHSSMRGTLEPTGARVSACFLVLSFFVGGWGGEVLVHVEAGTC